MDKRTVLVLKTVATWYQTPRGASRDKRTFVGLVRDAFVLVWITGEVGGLSRIT